jgi:hypothetical protein
MNDLNRLFSVSPYPCWGEGQGEGFPDNVSWKRS